MKFPLRSMLLIAASAITLAACDSTSTGPTQADYDTLQGQYDTLHQQYETAVAEKTQLESELASKQAELASLTAQLDDAEANVADLTSQIEGLQGEIADLEDQLAAATARVQQLSAANAALQSQLNNFNKNAYVSLQNKESDADQIQTTTAYQAATSDLAAKQAAKSAADAVLTEAQSYVSTIALAALDTKTVAELAAENAAAAAMYCVVTNCADNADLTTIDVVSQDYQDGLLPNADNDVINNIEAAAAALAASQGAFDVAEANYEALLGAISKSSPETLYDADGNAISAFGAVLTSSTPGANRSDPIPVDARITALFLTDTNGDLTDVLVWEAQGNPFTGLPAGAATFTSNNMMAYFAEEDVYGNYTMHDEGSGGSLTLNFNDNTGALSVAGLGGDFAIVNAQLTFNPATGTFSGSGDQSYTKADDVGQANGTISTAAGGAGQADATITGSLVGAGDAFTATIDAVGDYTTTLIDGVGNTPDPTVTVDVHIMTAIIGSGTVNAPQP